MAQIFCIKDLAGWYTTDPELVPGSKALAVGDYFRLPDGSVYLVKRLFPTEYVLIPESAIPNGQKVWTAKAYKSRG